MTTSATSTANQPTVDPGLTLVLAGTGKTGRRVAEGLQERGVSVRIGARSAEPRFDWTDAGTWDAALDGVQSVYLAYAPDLSIPAALEHVRAFTAAAERHGVERIVLLSGRGEREAEAAEQVVLASSIPSTVVRAAWFFQNFSEDFMAPGVAAGALVLPETTVQEPFIDARDIADIAIAAFTEPGHEGAIFDVTGPQLLTFDDAARILSEARGTTVAHVPLPMDVYLEGAAEQGVPQDLRDLIGYLYGELMDGRNASTTDTVEQVLGRPARRLDDYAREAAAAGAWDASATPATAATPEDVAA